MSDSAPNLSWESISLTLQNPFRISYGVSETRQAYWLRLAGDKGWGEGTIPSYYGIGADEMIAFWEEASLRSDPFPDEPSEIAAWIGEVGPAPARCALDLALHDRIGRHRGLPLYQLLNLPKPGSLSTSFTISIDTAQEMARQAAQVADYPILKIKVGSDDDESRLRAIRDARPDAELCVDANGAWTAEEAVGQSLRLEQFGLSFIEQPVAADQIEAMGFVQARVNVPVVADESVQAIADVERLAEVGVQGVNLKLMKLGGLQPTLRILTRARQRGMRIMLGCMIETSLGTTAMAHLAGLADWLDLDAPLLISNDPFEGLRYDSQAGLQLPDRPGIGAVRRRP